MLGVNLNSTVRLTVSDVKEKKLSKCNDPKMLKELNSSVHGGYI